MPRNTREIMRGRKTAQYVKDHIKKLARRDLKLSKELVKIIENTDRESVVSMIKSIGVHYYVVKLKWKNPSYLHRIVKSEHWVRIKDALSIKTDRYDNLSSKFSEMKRLADMVGCPYPAFVQKINNNGLDFTQISILRREGVIPPPPPIKFNIKDE